MIKKDNFILLSEIEGRDANLYKIAIDTFTNEQLSLNVDAYGLSLYKNNDEYVVIFRRADQSNNKNNFNYYPGYEVIIDAVTMTVRKAYFLR